MRSTVCAEKNKRQESCSLFVFCCVCPPPLLMVSNAVYDRARFLRRNLFTRDLKTPRRFDMTQSCVLHLSNSMPSVEQNTQSKTVVQLAKAALIKRAVCAGTYWLQESIIDYKILLYSLLRTIAIKPIQFNHLFTNKWLLLCKVHDEVTC